MERFAIRHPVSVLYSSKMVQFFSGLSRTFESTKILAAHGDEGAELDSSITMSSLKVRQTD